MRPALEEGPVLAVVDDESAGVRGGHGPAHDPAVRDGPSVVGKSDRARRDEAGHVDELRPLRAPRHRGDGQDVGQPARRASVRMRSVTSGRSLTGSVLGIAQTVVNPPRTAARTPVAMVSFCFEPGFPEMDVEVDEAGDDDEPRASTRSGRRDPPRPPTAAIRPSSTRTSHTASSPDRGIDDPAAADEESHRFLPPPILTGSAMRTSSLPSVSFRRTRTISRREVGRTLPDVVGPDGELAVAAVDEDDELDGLRPAQVDEAVHGRPDGPAGHQDVVDEEDVLLDDRERPMSF